MKTNMKHSLGHENVFMTIDNLRFLVHLRPSGTISLHKSIVVTIVVAVLIAVVPAGPVAVPTQALAPGAAIREASMQTRPFPRHRYIKYRAVPRSGRAWPAIACEPMACADGEDEQEDEHWVHLSVTPGAEKNESFVMTLFHPRCVEYWMFHQGLPFVCKYKPNSKSATTAYLTILLQIKLSTGWTSELMLLEREEWLRSSAHRTCS